jgi:hypothetical protein
MLSISSISLKNCETRDLGALMSLPAVTRSTKSDLGMSPVVKQSTHLPRSAVDGSMAGLHAHWHRLMLNSGQRDPLKCSAWNQMMPSPCRTQAAPCLMSQPQHQCTEQIYGRSHGDHRADGRHQQGRQELEPRKKAIGKEAC